MELTFRDVFQALLRVGEFIAYKTRHDATRQDKTRQDTTRQDKTRQDETRQDKTRQDKTQHDKTRQDKTRHDTIRRDATRQFFAYLLLSLTKNKPIFVFVSF
jgi:hypothetical protein